MGGPTSSYATAGIAVRVTESHKPPHQYSMVTFHQLHLDLDFKWWTQVSSCMIIVMGSPSCRVVLLQKVNDICLCASVSISGTHWVQILEYSSSPVIATTVPILVDRADHNSSVVMWLLLHISLLTWQMWGTTPYHSQPISLCHFSLLQLHVSLCHFSIRVWCCHLLSKILVTEYDWKCARYSLLLSSFL